MEKFKNNVIGELQSFIGENLEYFKNADIGEYVYSLENGDIIKVCNMETVPYRENTSRWEICDDENIVLVDITVDNNNIIIGIE